jgi:RND superfamily putative drug exporter
VIASWVVLILVSLTAIAFLLGDVLSGDAQVTSNPESEQAYALIGQRFPDEGAATDVVIVRSATRTVDDPAFRAELERLAGLARASGALPPGTVLPSADELAVSEDRHAVLIPVAAADIEPLMGAVEEADGRNGFEVGITGGESSDVDFETLSQDDLSKGELLVGAPAALLILLLVFGSVVSALVPVLLAIVSIVIALALTSLVGQATDLSFFVVNMITGMGLALGIDYSLFIVSRYREERARGRAKPDAIGLSGATASRAVLVSGLAFVLAMIGMVLVPDTVLRSLAIGAILVGVVSVAAALTLLPAVLGLLGDGVNALRIPFFGRSLERPPGAEGRFWAAIVRRVVRNPVPALVLSAGILVAATIPAFDLDRGNSGISTLPDRFTSKQGLLLLERSFPGSSTDPAQVVVDARIRTPEIETAIDRLEQSVRGRPPFGTPTLLVNDAGDLAVLSIPVGADPASSEAVSAVRELRDDLVPAAFGDARVLVTGEPAENVDYYALIGDWLPIVFVFVLGLSFILLTVAFRSIVIAAVAILLNLLSVGAAYGLLVLVFQKGYLADFLGFEQVDAIDAWVPLFLFSVLFGLSMDYQVFLLSRIKERFDQTGDTTDAVIFGVGSTARLITGAALIIIAVFCGFALGDFVGFQQMGFGVAVSLLIDATIVRCVLMPAVLRLIGDRAWYLPSWLCWLPRLSIEGPARG